MTETNNVEEKDGNQDLGKAIDERLKVSFTAGKILANSFILNSLLEVLIKTDVISADDFADNLKKSKDTFNQEMQEGFRLYADSPASAINDGERMLEVQNNFEPEKK